MKIFRIITLISLATCLSLAILSYGLLQQVATSSAVSKLLSKGGAYDVIAAKTRDSLASSPRLPAKYQDLFTASLTTAIDADQVELMLKPGIVDIATWFSQPSGTSAPDVIIVTKPAKDKLIQELSAGGLSGAELTALQSDLEQQIPDQLRLSSLEEVVNGTSSGSLGGATESADKTETASGTIPAALKQAKVVVNGLQLALNIFCLASLLLGLLLAWLSKKTGHTLLRAVSIAILSTGVFWSILGIIVPLILRSPSTPVSIDTLQAYLLPAIINHTLQSGLIPAVALALLGAMSFGLDWILSKR